MKRPGADLLLLLLCVGAGTAGAAPVTGLAIIDADQDGLADTVDLCPAAPEDLDGFQDSDGCPDADNDADQVPDPEDRCPDAPEDRDGYEDADGCPELDNDQDDIPDKRDLCPDAPEDKDGNGDDDGCPDDDDKDGVPDSMDLCPGGQEDRDGFEDSDGCADPNNDGDGFPDETDKCPDQPEDYDLVTDDDGCPETDDDDDGVPDDTDLCPDEPEDREGIAPQDGCRRPISETFEPGWLGEVGPSWEASGALGVADTGAGTLYAATGDLRLYWDWKAVVLYAPLITPLFGESGSLRGASVLGGAAGCRLLSWPRLDRSPVSLVNLDLGAQLWLVADFEADGPSFTIGPWISERIYLGPVALGVELRGAQFVSLGGDSDSATVFTVGYANHGN